MRNNKEKIKLLYWAYSQANKEESSRDVDIMRGIYGHYSEVVYDFDYCFFAGYTVWLTIHKRYKLLSREDIQRAYDWMKLMGMKIPKHMRRKMKRYRKDGFGIDDKAKGNKSGRKQTKENVRESTFRNCGSD